RAPPFSQDRFSGAAARRWGPVQGARAAQAAPGERGARRWPGRRPRPWWRPVVVVAVFGFLASGSIAVATLVASDARRDADARVRRSSGQVVAAVENGVAADVDQLRGVGAYLATAPDASRADFATFLRASNVLTDLSWLDGLLFVQKVDDADLDAFTARK